MNVTRRSFIVSVLALALVPLIAHAATKEELQKRFKDRDPRLVELKRAGTVGETYHGYVELVDPKSKDEDASSLVDEENADRKELYKLIAEKEGTTADVVAERNAKRVFEKAKPGEYLKGADGKWKQKEAAPSR